MKSLGGFLDSSATAFPGSGILDTAVPQINTASPPEPHRIDWVGTLLLAAAVTIATPVEGQELRVALDSPYLAGFSRSLTGEEFTYHSPIPTVDQSLLVRSENRNRSIGWESAPVPGDFAAETATFVLLAAIDANDRPHRFALSVDGAPELEFSNPTSAVVGDVFRWTGESVTAEFRVTLIDKYDDAMGFLLVHVPRRMLHPGEPVRFAISGQTAGSRAWFMVYREPLTNRIDLTNAPALLRTPDGPAQMVVLDVLDLTGDTPFRMDGPLGVRTERLAIGNNRLSVSVPAVTADTTVDLRFTFGAEETAVAFAVEPVRQLDLYLLHHSHVDIGYTHRQDEVERMQWSYLEEALRLGREAEDGPEDARFVWNTEATWAVDTYVRAHPERAAALMDGIRRGWIELDGTYANLLTGIANSEGLLRSVDASRRLAEMSGTPILSEMVSDIPGFSWGLVPALALNGIRYLSIGPNFGHRIGHFSRELADRPFYWESPSGQDSVLTWVSGAGYAWFHTGLGYESLTTLLDEENVFRYLAQLAAAEYPYRIAGMRYNIGSDNGPPDPGLAAAVAAWNERYISPRIIISGTTALFRAFEDRYGSGLPVMRGDMTGHWEDGAASSARETAAVRRTAESLLSTETLAAITGVTLPAERVTEAWSRVQLYYEHTWGAWNSIGEPESEFVVQQWERKKQFADSAQTLAMSLAAEVAGAVVDEDHRVANAVRVFNTLNWERTDLILVAGPDSRAGDRVRNDRGDIVPSQRLTTGQLAFLAAGIPPFGSRDFTIEPGSPPAGAGLLRDRTTLRTSTVEVTVDPAAGTVRSLIDRRTGREYVAADAGLNAYVYVAGRDPAAAAGATAVTVTVVEDGPLVATLRVEYAAPGLDGPAASEIRIVEGLDRVDLTNTLDKSLVYDPEALLFRFPFAIDAPEVRIDVPWGSYRPDTEQLPGASRNYFSMEHWVDIHDAAGGVTVASIDVPMIQLGRIRTDATVTGWDERVPPSGTLYSYVMTNYWETNYRAGQEGQHSFDYSMRTHGGFDEAAAERFGMERARPLVVIARPAPGAPRRFPMQIVSGRIVVTALKATEDGSGCIVRLFNPSGFAAEVAISPEPGSGLQARRSDVSETVGAPVDGVMLLQPFEIVTLRIAAAN